MKSAVSAQNIAMQICNIIQKQATARVRHAKGRHTQSGVDKPLAKRTLFHDNVIDLALATETSGVRWSLQY